MTLLFLDKLRRKSERERKKILFASTVILTALIAFFWVVSFRASSSAVPDEKTDDGPFAQIEQMLGSIFENVKTTVTSF